MKKIFALIALGSVSMVSADQYSQPYGYQSNGCPSCYNGGENYQDQQNNAYYQKGRDNEYQGQQQSQYQRNNQPNYQQQPHRNQPYNQNQQNDQNNQPYYQDQQKGYDNNRGYGNSSDQEIDKKIRDTLSSGWFSKGFQDVDFKVNNGNVLLTGSVNTLENKNKVEDSVKKIDGVRQVNNQITIVKESTGNYSDSQLQNSEKKYPQDFASNPQDRQLNATIRDKLGSGWFSKGYETLVIRTTNGVVVVSGTVDKAEDIQKISDQIKDVEGVKSVNNQLSVRNR